MKFGAKALLLAAAVTAYTCLVYQLGRDKKYEEVVANIASIQKTFYDNANETYRMAPGNGALHDFGDNLGGLMKILEAKQEGRLSAPELHDLEKQIIQQYPPLVIPPLDIDSYALGRVPL